jgi:hypothetical protein
MNPNFNWAIVAERMQALRSEADTAARARQARHSRHVLALAVAGVGRRHLGSAVRTVAIKAGPVKAGEAL